MLDPWVPGLQGSLANSNLAWLWQILYFGGPISFGESGRFFVLYSIVPWIGVMAAGYAFGAVIQMPPDRRRRVCLTIGLGAIAAFLLLRGFNLYGNPTPWVAEGAARAGAGGGPPPLPPALSFLNTNKYPAALLFLLMTLGPTIALIPALEGARGRLVGWLTTFGRVPFFYYVLHIPLIHTIAILVSLIRSGQVAPWLFANHPVMVPPAPEGYRWSLLLLYAITLVVVVILYYPSRWFSNLKSRSDNPWLRFL